MGQQYRIFCPHCREPLNCSENLFGRAIACPKCQEPFRIPSTAAFNAPPEPAAKAQPEPAPVRQPPPSVRRDVERPAQSPRPSVTKKPSLPPRVVGRRPKPPVEDDEDLIETELVDDQADNSTFDDFGSDEEDVVTTRPAIQKRGRKQRAPSVLRNIANVGFPLVLVGFVWFAIERIFWMAAQPTWDAVRSQPGFARDVLLLVIGSLIVYMIPGLIARQRKCRNWLALVFANFYFGWTIIGWLLVLLFSLTSDLPGNKKTEFRRQRQIAATDAFLYIFLSFDGRIPRRIYWISSIGKALFLGVMLALLNPLFPEHGPRTLTENVIGLLMSLIISLAWYTSFAIRVKRWHDRDRSAGWLLINLIPFLGILYELIELGFIRGTDGDNRFGPDPLA
ncbi:hypothetical protein AYO47_08280 [Planctomyces sp. SCGC AG-212-M04]|nr:hypothetical protein AYO47_08280 [Planctomyces sp. SCGC AG-212-M04]